MDMSTENGVATWFPLAAGIALFAATGLRSLHMRMRHGVNPYVIDHGKPVEGSVGAVFFVLVAAVVAYLALLAGWERRHGPAPWPDRRPRARRSHSSSWARASPGRSLARSRWVHPGASAFRRGPPLRTNGPFRLSRNPIFLGMLGFVLGLTVLTPNAVTITALVAAYLAISVQIRLARSFSAARTGPLIRLTAPGCGAGCDIAALAKHSQLT